MNDDIEFLRLLRGDLRSLSDQPARSGWTQRRASRVLLPFAVAALVAAALLAIPQLELNEGAGARPHTAKQANGPGSDAPRLGRGPLALTTGTTLQAVSAAGANDVWAVGRETTHSSPPTRSVILHWDGRSWTSVRHPDVGSLESVAAISATDVWAAGENRIIHFDGTTWALSPTPQVDGMLFRTVAAAGPSDVWIAGQRFGARWRDKSGERNVGYDTLAMHWDGKAWTVVPTPNPGRRHNDVQGLVSVSSNDAWIVGYYNENHPQTMTLHWNGTAWTSVASPDPGRSFNVLWGVGTDGDGTVWALGHYGRPGDHFQALYLRWPGEKWAVVPPPPGQAAHQTPTALSGASATDVFAVGSNPTSSLLLARWDGSTWTSDVADVDDGFRGGEATLNGVVAIDADAAWAVGQYQPYSTSGHAGRIEPVILRWDGSAWHRVATERDG